MTPVLGRARRGDQGAGARHPRRDARVRPRPGRDRGRDVGRHGAGHIPDEASSLAFSADGSQLAFYRREPRRGPGPGRLARPGPRRPAGCGSGADPSSSRPRSPTTGRHPALTGAGAPPAASLTPPRSNADTSSARAAPPPPRTAGPRSRRRRGSSSIRRAASPSSSPTRPSCSTQSGGEWLVTGTVGATAARRGQRAPGPERRRTPPVAGSVERESVVTVTFDSDLDGLERHRQPRSRCRPRPGRRSPLLGAPTYDPATREATLTVAGALPAGAEVEVGTGLADIDGGHPAAGRSTRWGADPHSGT